MINSLDTLLSELSGYNPVQQAVRDTSTLAEEDVTNFVIKKAGELVNISLDSVSEMRDIVIQGQDPEEIAALAGLISSTTGAIEALNKLVILQKRQKGAEKLEQIKLEGKKEVARIQATAAAPLTNTTNNTTNNVLVMNREEIFKKFLNDDKESEIIELTTEILPIEDK